MRHSNRLATALAIPVVLALTACGGGSGGGAKGPTEASGPAATLATSHGTITIYTNGNSFDANRAAAAIEAGYDKARAEVGPRIDGIRLDGMTVSVQKTVYDGAAVGQYLPQSDTVESAVGVENVLTHELQHRFCHNLGNSGDCCTYQDHANGYDLQCHHV